jgi:hypothetical protein
MGYKIGDQPAVYAWKARSPSPARWCSGCATTWADRKIGRCRNAGPHRQDNGGIYFVPAFSGLFAPYWRSDARGAIVGMTRFVNKGHIARAALEATAYQTREVLDAMEKDSGVKLTALKVDGGMVFNELLMQFQSDLLGVPVIRPKVAETTALGAAYAAGLAVGFWKDFDELRANWGMNRNEILTSIKAKSPDVLIVGAGINGVGRVPRPGAERRGCADRRPRRFLLRRFGGFLAHGARRHPLPRKRRIPPGARGCAGAQPHDPERPAPGQAPADRGADVQDSSPGC